MQFQVPQNITMEDRIVGPLTVIQFTILVIGGGLTFFIFNQSAWPILVSRGAATFFGVLTLLMALGKFNDQPMYRFFRYIIAFILTPKTRIWHKSGSDPVLIRASEHKIDESAQKAVKKVSRADIANLAKVLDSRGQAGMVPKNPSEPIKK